MEFSEFERRHADQCRANQRGWYETCVTLDGKLRPKDTVRASSGDHARLGESVLHGINGNMGSDIRRWPQSLFDASKDRHSVAARLQVHRTRCGTSDDRNAQYVRVHRNVAEIYKKMAPAFLLRWKLDSDGRHAQVQLAKAITSAEEMRESLVHSGYRALLDSARFPPSASAAYALDFAKLNSLDEAVLKATLQPRPGLVRLPVTRGGPLHTKWSVGLQFVDRETVPLSQDVDAFWCAHLGNRAVVHADVTPQSTPLSIVHRARRGRETTIRSEAGAVRWKSPRLDKTVDDVLYTYLTELAAPQLLQRTSTPSKVHAKRGGLGVDFFYEGLRKGTVQQAGYMQKGGGAVYTTDFGLSTGYPLTHTDDRTFTLDDAATLYRGYRNDAASAVHLRLEDASRGAFLGALHALSTLKTTSTYLVSETSDPCRRMRLAGGLKMTAVNDNGPEHARILTETDKICTTPDEANVRVKNRAEVFPLLQGCEGMVEPYFASSHDFNESRVDVEYMDAWLDAVADHTESFEVAIRMDGPRLVLPKTMHCLHNSIVFRFKRRRWANRMKPIRVRIDEHGGLPRHITQRSNITLASGMAGATAVLDNRVHQDPRMLLLTQTPVYRSTGQSKPFMMRPFPSAADLQSMLRFCAAPESEELFA